MEQVLSRQRDQADDHTGCHPYLPRDPILPDQ